MKTYFAPWEAGVESWIDVDGTREMGRLGLSITVYEPFDAVPQQARPLGELLAKHLDPVTGLITLRESAPPPLRATMDPAILREVPPSAMATLGFRFLVKAPAVDASAGEPGPGPLGRDQSIPFGHSHCVLLDVV